MHCKETFYDLQVHKTNYIHTINSRLSENIILFISGLLSIKLRTLLNGLALSLCQREQRGIVLYLTIWNIRKLLIYQAGIVPSALALFLLSLSQ